MAEDFEIGGPAPEESSNRPFLIAAGGIALLILLSIGCLAAYALFLAPAQLQSGEARLTQIAAQNATTEAQITLTAGARFPSPTTPPTAAPSPTRSITPTRVVVVASPTVSATGDAAQATANALATQRALTPSPTATALPSTGFADEGGFPGLLVLSAALVVVVIVARRMRMRPAA